MNEHDFLKSVGGKHVVQGDGTPHWNFGLVQEEHRSEALEASCAAVRANMPAFNITGAWRQDQKRYALWKAGPLLLGGKFLPYNYQVTGSCVGAGGGNMAKSNMAIEIALGNLSFEYKELFWLYTYGKSRQRDGERSPGEGSTGESYADAATQDGYVAIEEDPDLPKPKDVSGWMQYPSATELKWSNGLAAPQTDVQIALKHLIKGKAQIKSSADGIAALANGYVMTQASNFGFSPMVPNPQSNPPVRLVTWNGSWSHQTYIDEFWEHPTLGPIFRWGNNWGADSHGAALADEPPSSVYISAATFDKICQNGFVCAFSGEQFFPARDVTFSWTP